ncbi:MAG: porin [Chitinophagales bacterium]|nr:porin [Chitinophagales bacterium]MDW8418067.1 porin [Chitinophagales bacterium]
MTPRSALLIHLFFLLYIHRAAYAQFTLGNGRSTLQLSGNVTAYFKGRIYKPGENKSNNLFEVRNAQLELKAWIGRYSSCELQFDIAQLLARTSDLDNPAIREANFGFKIPQTSTEIRLGYGKVCYSRSNLVSFLVSPFVQRPFLTNGNSFSRRDIGITLTQSFWRQLINLSFGFYSGQGESILRSNNDPSGRFEYIGRLDISYPVRGRYIDIDLNSVPLPIFTGGINARYMKKQNTINDEIFLRVVGGSKLVYGADISFMWQGLSLQSEIHQMHITPNDTTRLFNYNTTFFRAGGYYAQIGYYCKWIKSNLALRYDEMNQNDLVKGYLRNLTASYCFMLNGTKNMLRFNYTYVIEEENVPGTDPLKWRHQFRLGWQYVY